MASIARALDRIKQDLRPFLPEESVRRACREAGYAWRERLLDPVTTLHLFVLQVLNGNTAITHLRHLAGFAVGAAAYCRARTRLPLAALQRLLRESSASMRQALAPSAVGAAGGTRGAGTGKGSRGLTGLWRGLRALLVDGSSTITPDTPALQKAFGQPKGQKKGCGFPVSKVLGLFDAFTGLVVEVLAFPLYTHDQSKVWLLHPLLEAGDLLVGDCGLCSFAHLAMLHARGVMGLFRMHQRQVVDFRPHRKTGTRARKGGGKRRGRARGRGREQDRARPTSRYLKRLGKHDQLVEWVRPERKPEWMSDEQYGALPATLSVREVRYRIPRKGQRTLCVTIATTLTDPEKYPKDAVAELYGVRWQVETHFAELKTTLKMRAVKCKTEQGVRKELAVYCLVYNLVHALMARAAQRQRTTPDRISFLDTVRWLLSAAPGEELPDLVVNPSRPGRHEPRVRKSRGSGHNVMTLPRHVLRKRLTNQEK